MFRNSVVLNFWIQKFKPHVQKFSGSEFLDSEIEGFNNSGFQKFSGSEMGFRISENQAVENQGLRFACLENLCRFNDPALLTQALLTQALLTQALLTQALLTQALLKDAAWHAVAQ